MKYEKVLPTQPLHRKPEDFPKGDLLFNIGLIDLFYEFKESNIASYADDTTRYSCAKDTQAVISDKLKKQTISNKFFHWFQYNPS